MNHSETKKLVVTTGVPSANVFAERVSLVNEAGQPISTRTDAELNSRYGPLGGIDTDPTLTYVGSVAGGNSPTFPLVVGDVLYVAVTSDDALKAYDISDQDNPVLLSTLSVGDGPVHLAQRGKYVFVWNQNAGSLQAVDASNPASMSITSTLTTRVGQRMALVGRYAVIGGPESGGSANLLSVVDTGDPAAMVEVGTLAVGTVQRNIAALSSTLIAVSSRDDNTIYVVSIANPSAPVTVGSIASITQTLTPSCVDPEFDRGRPYLYAAGYGTPGKFYMIDMTNPQVPKVNTSITISNAAEWMSCTGRYVFVSTRSSHSIDVIDVGNPAKPVKVQTLDVTAAGRLDRHAYANGRIYACDQTNGLIHTVAVSGGKKQTPPSQPARQIDPPWPALYKSLAADVVVSNSNSPAAVAGLTQAVEKNATYEVEGFIVTDAAATADIRLTFGSLTGATMLWTAHAPSPSTTSATNGGFVTQQRNLTDVLTIGGCGVGTQTISRIFGRLVVGSTAGNLALNFSQGTAEVSDTTLRAGSTLTLRRVA